MLDTEKLLNCPFCQSKRIQTKVNDATAFHEKWWCLCKKCFAKSGRRDTEKEAIEAWNTRSTPKEEWISVEKDDLDNVARFAGVSRPWYEEEFREKYGLPSPPTDQTEKECDNPDCFNGYVRSGEYPDRPIINPCPVCQKDQAIQEERRGE